jgi:hypothetical protein
VYNVFIL